VTGISKCFSCRPRGGMLGSSTAGLRFVQNGWVQRSESGRPFLGRRLQLGRERTAVEATPAADERGAAASRRVAWRKDAGREQIPAVLSGCRAVAGTQPVRACQGYAAFVPWRSPDSGVRVLRQPCPCREDRRWLLRRDGGTGRAPARPVLRAAVPNHHDRRACAHPRRSRRRLRWWRGVTVNPGRAGRCTPLSASERPDA
jgi:hypothetical protein